MRSVLASLLRWWRSSPRPRRGSSRLVAEGLVIEAEDTRLREMARIVSAELPPGASKTLLEEAVLHEADELAAASIRIAMRNSSTFVGGDANLPVPRQGSCESRSIGDTTLRACAVEAGSFHIVTGAIRPRHGTTLLLLSSLVAAVVAAIGAAFLGQRAARWALDPLIRLGHSLDQIGADEPKAVVVAGDDKCREIAELRAALASLLARLAAALDAARNFAADAAHELKTPLTVVRAELDLFAEEPLESASREAVEKVRVRVTSLVRLVERLLSFATAGDRARLTKEPVAIEDVVRDVIAKLGPGARARIHLQADAPGMVFGDEALLVALVENAADNALKFSGNRPVEIDVRELGDKVLLDVRDQGPGIAQADRARVRAILSHAGVARRKYTWLRRRTSSRRPNRGRTRGRRWVRRSRPRGEWRTSAHRPSRMVTS
ncbi:MAG TPA: HAMP domain-containing sensor histidine kinase [Polyangiaceae bacterium]|nr:HAMP domain-containing sensor histidine kinase [Polyangiaceae bacterium]